MRLKCDTSTLKKINKLSIVVPNAIVLLTASILSASYSQTVSAEVWADVRDNIISSNGVFDCTECHSYLKTIAGDSSSVLSRHSASSSADFDGATDLTAYNNITALSTDYGSTADATYGFADGLKDRIYEWAADFVNTGYMPMDPTTDTSPADGIIDDFVDATNLSGADMATILNWALQGAPYTAASATTSTATPISKTSATLNAIIDTNVHSGTAVPGTYFYEYEEEVPGAIGAYDFSTPVVNRSSTSSTTSTGIAISGLSCGTQYNFRAVATNGSGTTNGSNLTLDTSACTDPVIAGVTIVADATSQSATEDANADFAITVSDDDPGNLNWTKTNGMNGSVTLMSATSTSLTGSVMVRYLSTPGMNYVGSDSFTVTVTNATTSTSQTVTFNMIVNDDGVDAPVISGSTVNDNEDGVNTADGSLTPIAVSISAADPDNLPSYNWDVTTSNDGTPVFAVATGATPTLVYTPLADDNGSPADTFTVRVCDGGSVGLGNCDTQVVTVTLAAQQDTPTAVGEASGINVLEGATNVLITVIGNDTDPDFGEAATLTPVNVMLVTGDLSAISVVGQQIQLTHGGAEETTASVTYQVQDTTGRTSANTVTANISITGTDDPPISSDFIDAATVSEGATSAIDVVAQSNDPELATMSVCGDTLTTPTSGNATVAIITSGGDAGKVLYTHNGTDVASGGDTDTFTYQVNDSNDATCLSTSGNNSNFSTVTVNLAAVDDAPIAVADTINVAEGGTATFLSGGVIDSILANDTDEEKGTGHVDFVVNGNSAPAFSAAFSLTNADGTFSYVHDGSETTATSFTYTVNDGAVDSTATGTVTINISPVNDQPIISSVAPTTTYIEGSVFSYDVNHTDPDTVGDSYVYSLPSGAVGNMAIVSGTGVISWTVDRTGVFNFDTANITARVTDDDQSTAGANPLFGDQVFTIRTSPLDTDSDGVADYSDNCPTDTNAGQGDLDGDTVHFPVDASGIPANGDVDPAATDVNGFATGGDACDEDEDGDGIPDSIEDNAAFPFLNSRDAADAALDEDGDGLTNLQEYNSDNTGSTIDSDNVGPTVFAPSDVTVNATGLLTNVELGVATGSDGNDGESTIFKVAVDLSPADKIALAEATTGCQLFSNYKTDIETFRPGTYTVTWATCDTNGNSGQDDQVVNVKPLVSMVSGQSVGEGQAVSVSVMLNGDAIAYPATVNYALTGTAVVAEDHDAVSGVVTFNSKGDVGVISFNTLTDGVTEGDETIDIVLHSPVNMALSSAKRHTVTITETNVAPHAVLNVSQNVATVDVTLGNTVYQPDGTVTVDAISSDGNGNGLSYNWNATSSVLRNAAGTSISTNQLTFDPAVLTDGEFYNVAVTVSDGSLSVSSNRLLLVEAVQTVLTPGKDTDGDGVDDDDVSEGYGDDDADGIPNYLDHSSTPDNAIENLTANLETSVLIETDPGLHIAMGETAVAAGLSGVQIGLQDIKNHGSATGGAVTNAATGYTFLSSLLNFVISGLTDDVVSVHVVIPLSSAIQADTVVRKYNSTGWFDFVEDDLNELRSASGADGTCPQPGSSSYSSGLTPGHLCLQMTIQDGGANDADGIRNFVVKDPAGLALEPVEEVEEKEKKAKGRVGSLNLWFILMMSVIALVVWKQRAKSLR